mgnify:CR=1 FL=1
MPAADRTLLAVKRLSKRFGGRLSADVGVEGRTKNDVALVMQTGMTVGGRLIFDGAGEQPTDFSSTRILLASTSQNSVLSGSAIGQGNSDGTFKVSDVMPGRYRVTVTPPRGWRRTAGRVRRDPPRPGRKEEKRTRPVTLADGKTIKVPPPSPLSTPHHRR